MNSHPLRLSLLSAIAGALVTASPAVAIPPPLPVHVTYGPLLQCFNGYRVQATAREAVTVGYEGGIVVNNDDFILFLDAESPNRPAGDQARELSAGALGTIRRFVVPGERAGAGFVARGPVSQYVLPGREGGAVLVRSPQFDGSNRDLALLARIAPVDAAGDRCVQFGPPDFSGNNFDALYWSPTRHAAPHFHCQNGIGYALAQGETLQLTWSDESSWSRLYAGDNRLVLLGPTTRAERFRRARGPVAAGYDQAVNQNGPDLSILTLVEPTPRARNDQTRGRQISIQFRPGQEEQARAFAGRLEFVGRDDRRCGILRRPS